MSSISLPHPLQQEAWLPMKGGGGVGGDKETGGILDQ